MEWAREWVQRQAEDWLQDVVQPLSGNEKVTIVETDALYEYVSYYLRSICPNPPEATWIASYLDEKVTFDLPEDAIIEDSYQGARVEWVKEGRKIYVLTVKKSRDLLQDYLDHVLRVGMDIEHSRKKTKIYANYPRKARWTNPVDLSYPATFATVALPSDMKQCILNELDAFMSSREYYRSVGKTWKRSYLLYGPPGTGKSSLVAAIAKYMHYDIRDMDLSCVPNNRAALLLLRRTKPKSIILMEDVDCCVDLTTRAAEKKLTLSGLLNFCDGPRASEGDERIYIFTTNHIEKLDPTLVQKMDRCFCISYCRFEAFKTLAKNYLQLEDHELFCEVERFIETAYATPAEISEAILKGAPNGVVTALKNVIEVIKTKKEPSFEKIDDEEEKTNQNFKADNYDYNEEFMTSDEIYW